MSAQSTVVEHGVVAAPPVTSHPRFNLSGAVLLSIGCQDGREFASEVFSNCAQIYGIDVDEEAIEVARKRFPNYHFTRGMAECLPYGRHFFTAAMARVSLTYTDIPKAFAEIHRALKPRGDLFVSMHDWKHHWEFVSGAWKSRAIGRLVDLGFVTAASAAYNLTGRCFPKPYNNRFETFQTRKRMRRQLEQSGFTLTRMDRTERHWEIEAIKT